MRADPYPGDHHDHVDGEAGGKQERTGFSRPYRCAQRAPVDGGGRVEPGETGEQALRRKVEAEAGLTVTSVRFIGRRLHPKTSRVMTYGHVEVEPGEPHLGDPDDLEEVRWASIDETRTLMPDMYSPVRMYLDELQRSA